jgi:hypothetical protein
MGFKDRMNESLEQDVKIFNGVTLAGNGQTGGFGSFTESIDDIEEVSSVTFILDTLVKRWRLYENGESQVFHEKTEGAKQELVLFGYPTKINGEAVNDAVALKYVLKGTNYFRMNDALKEARENFKTGLIITITNNKVKIKNQYSTSYVLDYAIAELPDEKIDGFAKWVEPVEANISEYVATPAPSNAAPATDSFGTDFGQAFDEEQLPF